jgi:hypothetical protein
MFLQPGHLPQRLDRCYQTPDAWMTGQIVLPDLVDDVWELYDTTTDWS